jgi:glycosyltransferase involved in cell wall biosynthesis
MTIADPIDGGRLLRIELVVSALDVAGLEMVVANLTRHLAGRGHDVAVTCIERLGELGERLRDEGFSVSLVPTPGVLTNVYPKDLTSWFRERRPDVVHVHSGAWLKAARAAMPGKIPTIYTLHGIWPDRPWFLPYYTRIAARYTHAVATVTDVLREHLVRDIGLPPDLIRVIPNGIDTASFRPGPRSGLIRKRFNIPDSTVVIGTVARLHRVKNQTLMIDAFARVHAERPDTALVLVGDGPLKEPLAALAAERGIGDAVHFFGVTNDALAAYRDMDIFCLSSITEGTSISALEAMACGVYVVLSAVGGNPRLLADGRLGHLVRPPDDVRALAIALLDGVADPSLRIRFAALAREAVVNHYSLALSATRYLEIYRGALVRNTA